MPYDIKKVKGGYYVINELTNKKYSKKPLPEARAKAQMRALYSATAKEK